MKINTNNSPNRWGVILAGGDGTRLSKLTREICGDERPKQFCPLVGSDTMLCQTKKRVEQKIAPENILFLLTQKHRKFYQSLLSDISFDQLIVQPENKGTGAAILYALLKLAAKDPHATVAFFPSDHYFTNEKAFMSCVEKAFQIVETKEEDIVLLGIEPHQPEIEYGWIEAVSDGKNPFKKVLSFWEKPCPVTAQQLFERGCFWNSFVMVGKISAFLRLINSALPELYANFAAMQFAINSAIERAVIYEIYRQIPETNFSAQILSAHPEQLLLLPVRNVGWNDLGQADRVLETLQRLNIKSRWSHAAA
jgi:mannose-1-phosphate guanylyltransferase